jgi:adenylate cyclase
MLDDRKQIAAVIRDYIARERISREQFAFKTKLGKSTVDKLLTGHFSDKTLSIVESQTQLSLRPMSGGSIRLPDDMARQLPRAADLRPLDKPSIAVLPFVHMGMDPEQDFLADGITEDIITALARLRWLFVIARNSTFVYKGKAVDVRQVAHDLGIRYVLEGSVRTAGSRIRVTGQLIDAATGKHIWAEKYDREMQDIFAVQDDIAERVVAAVEPHLYAAEGFRASTQQLHYARAHALLSWAIWWASMCLWTPDVEAGYEQAAIHAQDALVFDPGEPWAKMVSGLCLSTGGQHQRALAELGNALTLNPSFALGHTALGWALLRAGRFEDAIVETGWALRMSPLDSFSGFYTTTHGLALLAAQRFEEALPFLRASVSSFTDYTGPFNTLISCCGHLGLIEEARELIAVRNRMGGAPLSLSLVRRHMHRFAHCDVFVDGLRKAGIPE